MSRTCMKGLPRLTITPLRLAVTVVAVSFAGCFAPGRNVVSAQPPASDSGIALARPDYATFDEAEAVRFNQTAKRRPVIYSRLRDPDGRDVLREGVLGAFGCSHP